MYRSDLSSLLLVVSTDSFFFFAFFSLRFSRLLRRNPVTAHLAISHCYSITGIAI